MKCGEMDGKEPERLIVPPTQGNQSEGPWRGEGMRSHPPLTGHMAGTQRGPGAATKFDQPHRDREGMCAIMMPCVCSPTVATLTPCHKIGCKIVHSVQNFHN